LVNPRRGAEHLPEPPPLLLLEPQKERRRLDKKLVSVSLTANVCVDQTYTMVQLESQSGFHPEKQPWASQILAHKTGQCRLRSQSRRNIKICRR